MFVNILVSIFFFAFEMLLLALAGILKLFPSFLKFARVLLDQFMELSYKFYSMILGQVAPFLQNRWGFNILVGSLRTISTIILSIIFGLLLFLILGLPISIWTVALFFIHGLAIGLIWGGVEHVAVEGFRMGENIQ